MPYNTQDITLIGQLINVIEHNIFRSGSCNVRLCKTYMVYKRSFDSLATAGLAKARRRTSHISAMKSNVQWVDTGEKTLQLFY